jgi:hypothetical protein
MAADKVVIRGVQVTEELYDFIIFIVHSFVRPISTELYSIRHNDCEIADTPKRLLVTIRNGKTGFRTANTMPGAVSAYERIQDRYPDAKGEDYIFLPEYKNRSTAARIFQRQFNYLLETAAIKHDPITDQDHTLYTTVSHTPEQQHFRVVFLLEQTILKATEWAKALAGLGRKLNADPSIKDAGRLFYGNSAGTFYILNKTLPASGVHDLIEFGSQANPFHLEQTLDAAAVSFRSSKRLGIDDMVHTAAGGLKSLASLPRLASVRCPHHLDRNHSAFVVHSANGTHGIHCMACGATFWTDSPAEYDFDAFDKLFELSQREERISIDKTVEHSTNFLLRYFPPKPTKVATNSRYLPPIVYMPGLTLVKSPKGTGKTEALKALVEQVRNSQYFPTVARADRCKSILLIGHRRALIQEACWKLGLDYYLDNGDSNSSDFYGVCLDSLPRMQTSGRLRKYDLVLIDESEQVLRHLSSDTIAKRSGGAETCFDALEFFIRSAKAVVVLDADLSLLTAHGLKSMRRQDWEHRCRIVYNKPPSDPTNKTLHLYVSRGQLVEDLRRSLLEGKKCFVTSNSKKMIAKLSKMIDGEVGGKIRQIAITSDNSRDPDNLEFLKNIQNRYLDIDVLLASPSLGTGIDISFPNKDQIVDCVYGFFVASVNTHTDIDQQLARVRNPGSVKVWVSPQRFNFETNFDVIRDDIARASIVRSAVEGYDDDGKLQYNKDHPLLMIYSHMICASRASRKNLLKLFCSLRQAQGWQIAIIRKALGPAVVGNRRLANAKDRVEKDRAIALMSAPQLSDHEFKEIDSNLRSGKHVPADQRAAHEKALIERTLGVTLSSEIIKLNQDGKLIDRVKVFSSLRNRLQALIFKDLALELTKPGTQKRWGKSSAQQLVRFVAYVGGLLDNAGHVDPQTIISQESLVRFITFSFAAILN